MGGFNCSAACNGARTVLSTLRTGGNGTECSNTVDCAVHVRTYIASIRKKKHCNTLLLYKRALLESVRTTRLYLQHEQQDRSMCRAISFIVGIPRS